MNKSCILFSLLLFSSMVTNLSAMHDRERKGLFVPIIGGVAGAAGALMATEEVGAIVPTAAVGLASRMKGKPGFVAGAVLLVTIANLIYKTKDKYWSYC